MKSDEKGGLSIYCCYHMDDQVKNDDDSTIWFDARRNPLNAFLSEFVMFHHIWKNDKDSKFIGTCHYRRRIRKEDFDQAAFADGGCQVYKVLESKYRTRLPWGGRYSYDLKNYCSNWVLNQFWVWKDYLEYTTKKYGKDNQYLNLDENLRNNRFEFIQFSCGILDREHFMDMCDYIFGFLDFIDKKYKLGYSYEKYEKFINDKFTKDYIEPQHLKGWFHHKRFFGYIFEKMYSFYIMVNLPRYTEIKKDDQKQ